MTYGKNFEDRKVAQSLRALLSTLAASAVIMSRAVTAVWHLVVSVVLSGSCLWPAQKACMREFITREFSSF